MFNPCFAPAIGRACLWGLSPDAPARTCSRTDAPSAGLLGAPGVQTPEPWDAHACVRRRGREAGPVVGQDFVEDFDGAPSTGKCWAIPQHCRPPRSRGKAAEGPNVE